jgi:hypothetical protein
MIILSSLLWLAATAAAEVSYPATIEVDLLFPRNETYSRNITTIPIIFAIQNGRAAYTTGWQINWNITAASSNRPGDSGSHFSTESWSRLLPTIENDFRYYFNGDVAVVPTKSRLPFASLPPSGTFRLDWEYTVDPCFPEGESVVRAPMPQVARGSHYFSLTADRGSGAPFDIPLAECPIYGDMWTKHARGSRCPLTVDSDDEGDRDPCRARLENAKQMDCLRDYFLKRQNETEACLSGFQRVTQSWIDGEGDTGGEDDSDGDTDEETDEERVDDRGSDDDEGAAVSLRPDAFGSAVAVMVAMVMTFILNL